MRAVSHGFSGSSGNSRELSRIPETYSSRQEGEVNMRATELKHAANLEEWEKRIIDCRASGLTVRKWCSQNAWSTSTYYRWEREVFGNLGEQPEDPGPTCTAIAPAPVQSLVEIPVAASGSQARAPAEVRQTAVRPPRTRKTAAHKSSLEAGSALRPVAVLRVGDTELSLTNAVSHKLMRQIKELLSHAE